MSALGHKRTSRTIAIYVRFRGLSGRKWVSGSGTSILGIYRMNANFFRRDIRSMSSTALNCQSCRCYVLCIWGNQTPSDQRLERLFASSVRPNISTLLRAAHTCPVGRPECFLMESRHVRFGSKADIPSDTQLRPLSGVKRTFWLTPWNVCL